MEFLDDTMVKAVNKYSRVNYEVKPGTLFFEFHGNTQDEVSLLLLSLGLKTKLNFKKKSS